MIKSKPIVYEGRYYNANQTCDLLEIDRELLSICTSLDEIHCVVFTPHNTLYTGEEILRFWTTKQNPS